MRGETVGVPSFRLAVNHNSVKSGNRDVVCQNMSDIKILNNIPFTSHLCPCHVFNHNVVNSLNPD